jgi:ribosomal protein S18 acetylase RimI-like enzyme
VTDGPVSTLLLVRGEELQIAVRAATEADASVLAAIESETWESASQPVPRREPGRHFFGDACRPANVLVAETDHDVVGYVRVEPLPGPPTASHVHAINGLAVAPRFQRLGVARRLVDAALAKAVERDARKVLLHVLSTNEPAIRLYRRAGFVEEGRLIRQFRLDGRYVDDLIMARHLTAAP